jgi:MoaA/NifB/PqqE/SkfB family radical SAM enzyme
LTAWNEHETQAMFDLADQLGVRLRFQGPVGPRDDGDTEPLNIQPTRDGWKRFMQIARVRAGQGDDAATAAAWGEEVAADQDLYCGAGTEEVLIDPFGNVFPCLHLRHQAGNLHQASLQSIWCNSRVFGEAKALSEQTVRRIRNEGPLSTLGAPLFCPGMEKKGCATCSVSA